METLTRRLDKINVDVSRRLSKGAALLGYVMKDHHARAVMEKRKQKGDSFILMAECLAVREAIAMTIQKSLQRIIIVSESQLIMNSINGKTCVPKHIINLVKDIRMLTPFF